VGSVLRQGGQSGSCRPGHARRGGGSTWKDLLTTTGWPLAVLKRSLIWALVSVSPATCSRPAVLCVVRLGDGVAPRRRVPAAGRQAPARARLVQAQACVTAGEGGGVQAWRAGLRWAGAAAKAPAAAGRAGRAAAPAPWGHG